MAGLKVVAAEAAEAEEAEEAEAREADTADTVLVGQSSAVGWIVYYSVVSIVYYGNQIEGRNLRRSSWLPFR